MAKPLMGRFTDTAVTLLCLIAVFAGVAAADHYDTRRVDSELAAISSGEGLAPGEGIIEARLHVFAGSLQRWTWVILPALSMLAGAVIGFGCTGWRWAWLMVLVGMLPALAMAVAFHIDQLAVAAAWACAYLAAGTLMATAIARHRTDSPTGNG